MLSMYKAPYSTLALHMHLNKHQVCGPADLQIPNKSGGIKAPHTIRSWALNPFGRNIMLTKLKKPSLEFLAETETPLKDNFWKLQSSISAYLRFRRWDFDSYSKMIQGDSAAGWRHALHTGYLCTQSWKQPELLMQVASKWNKVETHRVRIAFRFGDIISATFEQYSTKCSCK